MLQKTTAVADRRRIENAMEQILIVNGMMTTSQVAAYLQVSTSTLKAWRHALEGPRFARVGRTIRYSHLELERWVEGVSRKQRRQAA
ncbi:helix-turn-helix domain-containing protein [Pseudarthrobacter sp. ATCC 49987]|uniref:helix-turn-helix domain-containing protein n=1 Tax=Pseudarthrobacter sp. ATCC 49987 TaxID=2698204 RepID=UPI00136C2F97|nr:helix-turn-helix domain-containing protein [Pseudarthrobacter sp. ATCC 49987]